MCFGCLTVPLILVPWHTGCADTIEMLNNCNKNEIKSRLWPIGLDLQAKKSALDFGLKISTRKKTRQMFLSRT